MVKGQSNRVQSKQVQSKTASTMREQQVCLRLTELIRSLEQIESIVHVATAALEHQNSDRDEDVARVLQRSVGDRISAEIGKTAALLASLRKAPGVRARK